MVKVSAPLDRVMEILDQAIEDVQQVVTPYLGHEVRAEKLWEDIQELVDSIFRATPRAARGREVTFDVSEETVGEGGE